MVNLNYHSFKNESKYTKKWEVYKKFPSGFISIIISMNVLLEGR